jgi:hypothetical protein
MEERVCMELVAGFALVIAVTPRVLVFVTVTINVRIMTLKRDIGKATIPLACMKSGDWQQVNSRQLHPSEKI